MNGEPGVHLNMQLDWHAGLCMGWPTPIVRGVFVRRGAGLACTWVSWLSGPAWRR